MKHYFDFITELVFPRHCLGCQQPRCWLCTSCRAQIQLNQIKQANFDTGAMPAVDALWVAADYRQPLLQTLLHRYKYNFVVELGEPLGLLLVDFLNQSSQPITFDLIVPIPLAQKRLRWRMFNQSAELAEVISKAFGWPLAASVAVRHRYAHPQVGLSARHRKINVKGAFGVADAALVSGKRILLLDDVVTTGSTLNECAQTLQLAGAAQVTALVIARG